MFIASVLAVSLMAGPAAVPTDGNAPSVRPGLYTGQHFNAKWEPWRRCVVWRESRDNPKAANRTSSARGLYQFLDRSWRKSLTYMLIPEHQDQRAEIVELRSKPIHHWPRYWQDAAFWTVLNHGAGAKHWALQGSACNGLRP
jgi:hypothetical protein